MRTRRKFSSKFKTTVALEAIKGVSTLHDLSQKYSLTPAQIAGWKKEFLSKASMVFDRSDELEKENASIKAEKEKLYSKIGKLQTELDFLEEASSKLFPLKGDDNS